MSDKSESSAGDAIGLFLFFPALLFEAFVVMTMWRWFVVPLGAPALGMAMAYGVSLTVAFVVKSPHAVRKDDGLLNLMGRQIGWSVACLTFGYLAHLVAK